MSLGGHSLLHWQHLDWNVLLKEKKISNALVYMMMQNLCMIFFYEKIMII